MVALEMKPPQAQLNREAHKLGVMATRIRAIYPSNLSFSNRLQFRGVAIGSRPATLNSPCSLTPRVTEIDRLGHDFILPPRCAGFLGKGSFGIPVGLFM
jgi:hypothetical protein